MLSCCIGPEVGNDAPDRRKVNSPSAGTVVNRRTRSKNGHPSGKRAFSRHVKHRIRRNPGTAEHLFAEMRDVDLVDPKSSRRQAVDEVAPAVLADVVVGAVVPPALLRKDLFEP
jgi:hypothetical protein